MRSSFACVSSVACAAAAVKRVRSRAAVSWAAKALSTCRSAPVEVARERELDVLAERQSQRRIRRAGRRLWPGRRLDPPLLLGIVAGEHAHAVEAERRPDEHDEVGQRVVVLHVGREAGERLGVGPSARRVARAPRRRIDERAHDRGDDQEDDEREHVLVLVDRERVVWRREVAVRAQERDDGGAEREHRPADRRHHDDEQQEQQQHRRECEVTAGVRERERQQGHADHRDQQPGEPPARRERRGASDPAPVAAARRTTPLRPCPAR